MFFALFAIAAASRHHTRSRIVESNSPIRQSDYRFNENIRRWGCAFMSICWCGGCNSIDGCMERYSLAVRNGWIRTDCYIKNWYSMLPIAKAKGFRCGEKDEQIKSNEKEILKCQNTNTTGHFVVGNGNGGIEYDPYSDGFVSYGDCVSKRIFIY